VNHERGRSLSGRRRPSTLPSTQNTPSGSRGAVHSTAPTTWSLDKRNSLRFLNHPKVAATLPPSPLSPTSASRLAPPCELSTSSSVSERFFLRVYTPQEGASAFLPSPSPPPAACLLTPPFDPLSNLIPPLPSAFTTQSHPQPAFFPLPASPPALLASFALLLSNLATPSCPPGLSSGGEGCINGAERVESRHPVMPSRAHQIALRGGLHRCYLRVMRLLEVVSLLLAFPCVVFFPGNSAPQPSAIQTSYGRAPPGGCSVLRSTTCSTDRNLPEQFVSF